VDLRQHIVVKRAPILGHHDHVDTRIDRLSTAIWSAARHLTNAIPIADDKPIETQLSAQHVC